MDNILCKSSLQSADFCLQNRSRSARASSQVTDSQFAFGLDFDRAIVAFGHALIKYHSIVAPA